MTPPQVSHTITQQASAGLAACVASVLQGAVAYLSPRDTACVGRTCKLFSQTASCANVETKRQSVRRAMQAQWNDASKGVSESDMLKVLGCAVELLGCCNAKVLDIESSIVSTALLRVAAKYVAPANLHVCFNSNGCTRAITAVECKLLNLPSLRFRL